MILVGYDNTSNRYGRSLERRLRRAFFGKRWAMALRSGDEIRFVVFEYPDGPFPYHVFAGTLKRSSGNG